MYLLKCILYFYMKYITPNNYVFVEIINLQQNQINSSISYYKLCHIFYI